MIDENYSLTKQCKSRSAGFLRSQLIWKYTVSNLFVGRVRRIGNGIRSFLYSRKSTENAKNTFTKQNDFQNVECVVDEILCPDKTTFAKSVCPHQLVCGQREMN